MEQLALFIKTKAKPGKRDEVRSLWEVHLKPRAESNDAQEVYFYCYDDNDTDTLYIFEYYTDREVFEANAQEGWFAEYMKEVGPLLAEPPEVGITTPIWIKRVTAS